MRSWWRFALNPTRTSHLRLILTATPGFHHDTSWKFLAAIGNWGLYWRLPA